MVLKIIAYSLILLLVLISCKKESPNVEINADKAYYLPGETMHVNVQASSKLKMTYLWVTVETVCGIYGGFNPRVYKGWGTFLEMNKRSHNYTGEFDFFVPYEIYNTPCAWGDFITIVVFCEIGRKQYTFRNQLSIN